MTSNNRTELIAVIRALTALSRPCRLQVATDGR
jgi:ribonuclease HI